MYLHKELETLTRPEIEKLQLERLQKTVRHCMNSPFYKQRFAENHLSPEDIRSLDDLQKYPFTTKQDLRDTYPFGLASVPLEKQSAFTHPVEQPEIPLSFCIPKKTLTNGLMQWPAVFIW